MPGVLFFIEGKPKRRKNQDSYFLKSTLQNEDPDDKTAFENGLSDEGDGSKILDFMVKKAGRRGLAVW